MRTVNIGTLKNELSAYLKNVRAGEEILVRDRSNTIARIVPMEKPGTDEVERELVRNGEMTLPRKRAGRSSLWSDFWSISGAALESDLAISALIESRGDR